jgi:hypothetical protein
MRTNAAFPAALGVGVAVAVEVVEEGGKVQDVVAGVTTHEQALEIREGELLHCET